MRARRSALEKEQSDPDWGDEEEEDSDDAASSSDDDDDSDDVRGSH